ncbi:MAG TPA: hypothetical protein VHG52_00630 [Thermomicrobiales bacterium]|nr:hypothetical protein [Thermomicrobiales bacterium]
MPPAVLEPLGATTACWGYPMGRGATNATWEYLTLPETERDRLAHLGTEGWELVAIGGAPDERLLYLKRPAQIFAARVTTEQRNRYYMARGLDPERDAT